MPPAVAASDVERHARRGLRHRLDEGLQAAIRPDRLREPVGAQPCPLVPHPRDDRRHRQGKDVQDGGWLGDPVALHIGLADQRRGGGQAGARRQDRAFDDADHAHAEGIVGTAGAFARMEILGIEPQQRAVPAGRLRGGRKGCNIVGDVEIGLHVARPAQERGDRRSGAARRHTKWNVQPHGRKPLGQSRGGPRGHPFVGRARNAHHLPWRRRLDLVVGFPQRGVVVADDGSDVVARAVQRIRFLEHPRVGGEIAGTDDADRACHGFGGQAGSRSLRSMRRGAASCRATTPLPRLCLKS